MGIVEVAGGGETGVLLGDIESMDSFVFKLFCETAAAAAAAWAWAWATAWGRKLKTDDFGMVGRAIVDGGGLAFGLGESRGLHRGGLPKLLVVVLGGTGGTTTEGGGWW